MAAASCVSEHVVLPVAYAAVEGSLPGGLARAACDLIGHPGVARLKQLAALTLRGRVLLVLHSARAGAD